MPENDIEILQNTSKTRKSQVGISLSKVNLERLQKRLENIIDHHTRELWRVVKEQELNKDQCMAVCNYLKLLKDLKKQEDEALEAMSTEDLQKLMAGNVAK